MTSVAFPPSRLLFRDDVNDFLSDHELSEDSPSPLWRILDSVDVFELHILPKLDVNALKFFTASNRACKKLVLERCYTNNQSKRKQLKRKLRKPFCIHEMTSESTLEYAFERRPNEMKIEEFVSRIGTVELLEFAKETKGWRMDSQTPRLAACAGNLRVLKYIAEKQSHLLDEGALVACSFYERKECLRFLMEKNVPADRFAFGIGAFSRRWKAMFDAYERIVQNTTLDDDDDFCEKKSENESILTTETQVMVVPDGSF